MVQDRGYMVKEGRALRATSSGRVLSAFLQHYVAQCVDYEFTSDMESQLADVARLQCINECSCWSDSSIRQQLPCASWCCWSNTLVALPAMLERYGKLSLLHLGTSTARSRHQLAQP